MSIVSGVEAMFLGMWKVYQYVGLQGSLTVANPSRKESMSKVERVLTAGGGETLNPKPKPGMIFLRRKGKR